MPSAPGSPLDGRRVLIVDDESYVAMMLEDMLEDLGCRVVAVAQSLEQGLALARSSDPELAILDVNLRGQVVTPVAELLAARGVPFLFSTGYGAAGLAPEWRDRPVLSKPFAIEDLAAALRRTLAQTNAAGPGPRPDSACGTERDPSQA